MEKGIRPPRGCQARKVDMGVEGASSCCQGRESPAPKGPEKPGVAGAGS